VDQPGGLKDSSTGLAQKRSELLERLSLLPTGQDRLMYLVEDARKTPAWPPELRTDEYRVEGCLSNLWFKAAFRDGRCYFEADADSHVVRGIALLLCRFYSGSKPEEILACEPTFLAEAGITQHLSPNRRNGLSRLWSKIRGFADDALRRA
jgi:cysteine desulfuration protein SufE